MADPFYSSEDILKELQQWGQLSNQPSMVRPTSLEALNFNAPVENPYGLPVYNAPAAPKLTAGAAGATIETLPGMGNINTALGHLESAARAQAKQDVRTERAGLPATIAETADKLTGEWATKLQTDPAYKELPWAEKNKQTKTWIDTNIEDMRTRMEAVTGKAVKPTDPALVAARKKMSEAATKTIGARPEREWTNSDLLDRAGYAWDSFWINRDIQQADTPEKMQAAVAAQTARRKQFEGVLSDQTIDLQRQAKFREQTLRKENLAKTGKEDLTLMQELSLGLKDITDDPMGAVAAALPSLALGLGASLTGRGVGTAVGGAIGSVVPGAGTAAGAAVGGTIGAGLAGVATGATLLPGEVAGGIASDISQAPIAELQKSSEFNRLLQLHGGDQAKARVALTSQAIKDVDTEATALGAAAGLAEPFIGAVKAVRGTGSGLSAGFASPLVRKVYEKLGINAAVTSAPVKEVSDKLLAGVSKEGFVKTAVKRVGEEMGQETFEEGGGQFLQNVGQARGAGLEQNLGEGVARAAAAGAVTGGLLAGGTTAAGKGASLLRGPVTEDDGAVVMTRDKKGAWQVARTSSQADGSNIAVDPQTGMVRLRDMNNATAGDAVREMARLNQERIANLAGLSGDGRQAGIIAAQGVNSIMLGDSAGTWGFQAVDPNTNQPLNLLVDNTGAISFADPTTADASAQALLQRANALVAQLRPGVEAFASRQQNYSNSVVSTQQPTGTQPTGTQPTGTQPTGTQPTGTQPTGPTPTGTQPTGPTPAAPTQPAAPVVSAPQQPTTTAPGALTGVLPTGAAGFTQVPTGLTEPDMPNSVGQWFSYGGVEGQLVKRGSGYYIVPADRPQDAVFVEGGESGRLPASLGLTRFAQQPNPAAVAAGRATQDPTQLPVVAARVSAENAPTSLDDRFNAAIDGLVELLGEDAAASILESLTAPGQNFETLTKRIEARYYEEFDAATSPTGQAAPVQPDGSVAPDATDAAPSGAATSAAATAQNPVTGATNANEIPSTTQVPVGNGPQGGPQDGRQNAQGQEAATQGQGQAQVNQEPTEAEIQVELERQQQESLQNFEATLNVTAPSFFSTATKQETPVFLSDQQKQIATSAARQAVSMGLPHSMLSRITAAGQLTGARWANTLMAVVERRGWLFFGANPVASSGAEQTDTLIHELGHTSEKGGAGDIDTKSAVWNAAHEQLKTWYNTGTIPVLGYPFAKKYRTEKMRSESFAQAFSLYFSDNALLLQNAPAAHRAIAEIVTKLQKADYDRARVSAGDRKNAGGAQPTVAAGSPTDGGRAQPANGAVAGPGSRTQQVRSSVAGQPAGAQGGVNESRAELLASRTQNAGTGQADSQPQAQPGADAISDQLPADQLRAGDGQTQGPAAAKDTINVDGVERPRTNSNGQPIAGSDDAIRNFWRWFGDSKVVDAEGKPLVVYHGTKFSNIRVFQGYRGVAGHFAFDPEVANDFAKAANESEQELLAQGEQDVGDGGQVYPVYLKAENIFDARNPKHISRVGVGPMFDYTDLEGNAEAIKAAGFDSYYDFETGLEKLTGIAVFDPTQIKSATGNRGTFNPTVENISEMQPAPRVGASLLRQPAATQPGPRAPGTTLAALQGGQAAQAASLARGITQALTSTGTVSQKYNKAKPFFAQWGDRAVEAFVDALVPMVRWTQKLPISPVLREAILGAMYRAPNIRDRVLERAQTEFGGDQANEALATMLSRLRQRNPNATAEDVVRDAGFWLTARYALVKNERMLRDAEDAMLEAELQLQTAQQNNATAAEIAELQATVDTARVAFEDRQHALAQPVATNVHLGRVRGANPAEQVGLAGGMNNAQADAFMQRAEKLFGKPALESMAKDVYRVNAFRIATDLESGRVSVDTAVLFSPEIASTEQKMRDLVRVTSDPKSTQQQREAARMVFINALTATGSTYVPTTGVPEAGFEGDVLGAGYKTPNVAREKRLGGRATSLADDGITASFGGLQRSAAAAGWGQFSELIEQAYENMTPEQRTAAGMKQVDITALQRLGDDVIIRNRPDGTAAGYSIGDGRELRALRRENVEEKSRLMRLLELPTRAFATLAVRWNIPFGPVNMIRDVWERSENMRARSYTTVSGKPVDSAKAAARMLAIARDPNILKDIGAAYWAEARDKPAPNNKYALLLREFEELGGGGGKYGVSLARDRKTLAKDIDRARNDNKFAKSLKAVNSFVNFWNDTFDSVAPLAAYMALREQGMSKEAATAGALDLMNFRKTGAFMPVVRMIYAFAQPTVTGAAGLVNTLKTPVGRKRFLGYTMAFVAWQAMAAMLAGDDEETGKPKFDALDNEAKERSIPLPLPDGSFLKIPLGFGLPLLANQTALFFRDAQDVNRGVGGAAMQLAERYLRQVVPVGDSKIENDFAREFVQTFAPTVLAPLANVAINRTGLGAEIIKEAFLDKDRYRSEQGSPMTAEDYKDAAKIVRNTLGLDFAPEQIKELSNAFALGIFRDARDVLIDNPWKEELGRPTKTPVLGRLSATTDNAILADSAKFEREGTEVSKRQNANPDLELSARDQAVSDLYKEWEEVDKGFRARAAALTRAGTERGPTDPARAALREERQAAQAEIIRRFNQFAR